MIAPLIALTAPWALELLVGPAYRESAHSMAAIGWALAPYAAAQIAMAALNGLGHHRAAAIVALSVVGVHVAMIPLLWSLGPLVAVHWSLVIGASVGCVLGLLTLGQVLEPRGHLWWLGPAFLVAAAGTLVHANVVPGANAIAATGILVIAIGSRMLGREELRYIARQLGRGASDTKTKA